jgi:hypothetical protein
MIDLIHLKSELVYLHKILSGLKVFNRLSYSDDFISDIFEI